MTRSGDPWTRVEMLPAQRAVLLRVGGEIDQTTAHALQWGMGQALVAAAQARARRLLDLEQVGSWDRTA